MHSVFAIDDRAALGETIAGARKTVGLSQRELEGASLVPQGKISRIERGVTYPTIREIALLAEALNLRIHLVALEKPLADMRARLR